MGIVAADSSLLMRPSVVQQQISQTPAVGVQGTNSRTQEVALPLFNGRSPASPLPNQSVLATSVMDALIGLAIEPRNDPAGSFYLPPAAFLPHPQGWDATALTDSFSGTSSATVVTASLRRPPIPPGNALVSSFDLPPAAFLPPATLLSNWETISSLTNGSSESNIDTEDLLTAREALSVWDEWATHPAIMNSLPRPISPELIRLIITTLKQFGSEFEGIQKNQYDQCLERFEMINAGVLLPPELIRELQRNGERSVVVKV